MSNIYGIYGLGTPGSSGEIGNNGYSTIIDSSLSKDGSIVNITIDNSIDSMSLSEYYIDQRMYYLTSLSTNVYEDESDNKIKKYQINYSLNSENIDDLKIFAYLLFDNTLCYDPNSENSKFIILKNFYEPIDNTKKSNVLYEDSKKLTKIILFAFKKKRGFIFDKLFLGEKDF